MGGGNGVRADIHGEQNMKRQTKNAIAVVLVVLVASVWIKISGDREFEASLKESQRLSDEINAASHKEFESRLRAIRTGAND